MKLVTVVGARPQIIKSAAVTRRIQEKFTDRISEILIHTGQHYDAEMSDLFFGELQIPEPKYNLSIGSMSHGEQTAAMLAGIERTLGAELPDCVLIYGDTNSTVAAALAASKLGIPVAHVEAGMRSYNKSMPEELNRVLTDHASTFLYCPTDQAVANLLKEGFSIDAKKPSLDAPFVSNVGDVMYDNAMRYSVGGDSAKEILGIPFERDRFALATVHRASNTTSKDQVMALLEMLAASAKANSLPMLMPLHPRTRAILGISIDKLNTVFEGTGITFIPPTSYIDTLWLLKNAKLVVTDSGGLQKEAGFFNTPSVVLRTETEWVELIDCGLAVLSSSDPGDFGKKFSEQVRVSASLPAGFYGDGDASGKILDSILTAFP